MQFTMPTDYGSESAVSDAFSACARVFCAIFLICAVVAVLFAPGEALAQDAVEPDDYSILQVDINANIQSDGSLHVIERRTLRFDSDRARVCWRPDVPGGEIQVDGMSVAQLSSPSQDEVELLPLPKQVFNVDWKKGGGPNTDAYAFDVKDKALYAFFSCESRYAMLQCEYVLPYAVSVYNDCADLKWKYLKSGQWLSDSENVTCSVSFPVPVEDWPVVGQDVFAWCHGPDGSQISFDDWVNVATFWQQRVPSDVSAEARILIPQTWISNIEADSPSLHTKEVHKASVLEEEREWVDWQTIGKVERYSTLMAIAIASLALILIALVLYLIFGRNYKVSEAEVDDCPLEDVPAALVGRLWRWGRPAASDFAATVMQLALRGAIDVRSEMCLVPNPETGEIGESEEFYLVEVDKAARADMFESEVSAMRLLFDVAGNGAGSVWIGSLVDYAAEKPESFARGLDDWQSQLSSQVAEAGYFEKRGWSLQKAIALIGLLYAAAMAILAFAMHDVWPLAFGIMTFAALYSVSNVIARRSLEGERIYARCLALRGRLAGLVEEGGGSVAVSEESAANAAPYAVVLGVEPHLPEGMEAVGEATDQIATIVEKVAAEAEWSLRKCVSATRAKRRPLPWKRLSSKKDREDDAS